jgi:hypothetical protein
MASRSVILAGATGLVGKEILEGLLADRTVARVHSLGRRPAGCIISKSEVRRSILGPNVRVHSYCDVQDSILMCNAVVNRHARIRRAIIDRDLVVPRGAIIGFDRDEDGRRHTVSENGVVVVTAGEECLVDPRLAAAVSS